MKNPGNFDSDIHATDHRAKYEKSRADMSLFFIDGRDKESLAGNWTFMTDPYESALRADWYREKRIDASTGMKIPFDFDFDLWPRMKVPSCWNTERSDLFLYENMGLYFRTFTIERKDDERIFLFFEGVAYRAYVFLNGEYLAMHDGASTPFSIEITDCVRTENRLIVAVDASRSDRRVPMSNTDWFNYGGIYRDVYIVRTPSTFIRDFFLRLVPDSGFGRIALDVCVDGTSRGEVLLSIPELGIERVVTVENGKGYAEIDAFPILWSPDEPKLYEVKLSCEGDEIFDRIGFREIKVEGRRILLNGKDIFLKGISCHEDDVDLGKSTTRESILATISNVKDGLCGNFIRLAHYPHTREFARLADEKGILLWEEIPVYWAIAFDDEGTYRDAENQLAELVTRDRNRASVIIWSVGNENPDTDARFGFMSALAAKAKALDDTRCVSAACLVNKEKEMIEDRLASRLDIIGINEYYGWYTPDITRLHVVLENSNPDRPVIITEFGADARAGNHGPREEMWTEEFQAELYRRQTAEIGSCIFIRGMTPWILYDFRAVRRLNRYQEGFNRKGLIDSDRKTRKLAFRVLADFYRNM